MTQVKKWHLALFVGLLALWVSVGSMVGLSSLPFSPLSPSASQKGALFSLMPQGWGFFTRNPREARISVYVRGEEGWEPMPHHHSHYANFFGASRKANLISGQLGHVFQDIGLNQFVDCTDPDMTACMPDTVYTVHNTYGWPVVCGEILVKSQEPVPWAWSQSADNITMPYQLIRVNVVCDE